MAEEERLLIGAVCVTLLERDGTGGGLDDGDALADDGRDSDNDGSGNDCDGAALAVDAADGVAGGERELDGDMSLGPSVVEALTVGTATATTALGVPDSLPDMDGVVDSDSDPDSD